MRIKLRGPSGSSVVELPDTATVGDLLQSITEKTSLKDFDIKYGFPPKILDLKPHGLPKPLSELDVKLNGEQLVISSNEAETKPAASAAAGPAEQTKKTETKPSQESQAKPQRPLKRNAPESSPSAPLSLARKSKKSIESDPPEIPLPTHGATLILRIMPDDNSCLFRAIGTAVLGSIDSMNELRSLVASAIHDNPDVYPAAILGEEPTKYCEWIQMESSWGGGIELAILSQHFDVEICSIDVQSLRVDRYNEGRPARCIIVYSGIHYDTIAYSPSDPPHTHAYAPPDFDVKVFSADDEVVLDKAVELCRVLNGKHYFTDTTGFTVKCNTCGATLKGEKGATEHNKQTGHVDFSEAG